MPIAVAVVRFGNELTIDQLRKWTNGCIARFKLPTGLHTVETRSHNASGKAITGDLSTRLMHCGVDGRRQDRIVSANASSSSVSGLIITVRFNAIDAVLKAALIDAFDKLENDLQLLILVIVRTGRSFFSGADLATVVC